MTRVRAVGIFTFPALCEQGIGTPCLVPVDYAMKRRFTRKARQSTQGRRGIHPEAETEGGDLRYILHAGLER